MTCTFFGHDIPVNALKGRLTEVVSDLIENKGVDRFYVGTHGDFDSLATEVLSELCKKYKIEYFRVLSKIPTAKDEFDRTDYSVTLVPDGLEKAMPKYRITWRNRWMIKQSDYVVTYIINPYGSGAAKYAALAERQGKRMIKLGEY